MSSVIAGMDPRERALELIECGLVSAEDMLAACIVYMSSDEVADMLHANEFEVESDEDDGQPDEQQEWHDFDPDC
jgi:hypothetical protein